MSAFDDEAVVLDVSVPGGAWELAVRRTAPMAERVSGVDLFRWGGHAVAVLLAVLVFLVLEERRRVARMALVDPLTGLPNRRQFRRRLRRAVDRSRRERTPFALLYIDLNGFKEVNDQGGHGLCDRVLAAVAGRMAAEVGRGELLARLGGDEFAMLLPDAPTAEAAAPRAGRLRAAIRRPFPDLALPVAIDASIGVAVHPDDGRDADALLRAADRSMYDAKHAPGPG
jgi:diguanylate cyclase (GGDEF)-like protein